MLIVIIIITVIHMIIIIKEIANMVEWGWN